jgi:hypothetical protein
MSVRSPALPEALKAEFRTSEPGKYDPRHHAVDGINLVSLNSPSLPIVRSLPWSITTADYLCSACHVHKGPILLNS